MPKTSRFRSKLLKHHFGDISATEGFVANMASVRVLSCMSPIKCLFQKLLILVPNQLLIQATRVMFGQQKVLLQMWQVRVLSYMGLIYQIFMPKNFSFSFQTLKTRHFGDVSATERVFLQIWQV